MDANFIFRIPPYQVSRADLLRTINDPTGEVYKRFRRVGRTVVAAARAQVGKNTGQLARSIDWRIQLHAALPELWIGSYDPIAYIHHEGTRPHAISARNAQFLRFSSRGRVVYARTVMHPGTAPNRFLTDNIYLARI